MALLNSLEQRFGKFAIPNLTFHWVLAQAAVFVFSLSKLEIARHFVFKPTLVQEGEVWRVVTFLLSPPIWPLNISIISLLLLAIAWYMLWFMGRRMEETWGDFRYNAFVLTAWLLTIALSFLSPSSIYGNSFIISLIFLAFAFTFPNFQLMLFFVLPVKIKWLGILTWIIYGLIFIITPAWSERLMIIAISVTFILFFQTELRNLLAAMRK